MFKYLWLTVLLAIACGACDADQEDPFDDYQTPKIDWPSLDPNRYHWDGLQDPYYEGWFFRVVLPDEDRSFAFLYTVLNPGALESADRQCALVAVSSDGEVARIDLPADEFHASKQRLDARLGESASATTGELTGEIGDGEQQVNWSMSYDVAERWVDTMGLLTNVPYLPVNWYVGALQGYASGTIAWNDREYTFANAKLFQDKNWGGLFPDAYVWLQGMNFSDPNDAVVFAGGPVSGAPSGMFAWRHGEDFFTARSQDLNTIIKVTPEPENGEVTVEIFQDKNCFVLTGRFADLPPAVMPAPSADGFDDYSRMSLTGELSVKRYELVEGQWLLRDSAVSNPAGVELGGEYSEPAE